MLIIHVFWKMDSEMIQSLLNMENDLENLIA
jgi:hypothetical protein